MAHINFLDEPRFGFRQFNLRSLELNYFWIVVILCVAMLIMLTFGLVQRHRIAEKSKELAAAVAAAVKPGGPKPAQAGAPRVTIMDSLTQRVVWSPILNAIANHTPDTISLSYIKGASMVNRGVQIEGSGADVLATVRYEEELSTLPVFSKVFLKSSSGQESVSPGSVPAAKSDAKPDAKADVKPESSAPGTSQPAFVIQTWLK